MERMFTPVHWCYPTCIYEVNVRQYTPEGTFSAFSKHLPRLRSMGVGTLWFMPITPISQEKRLGSLGSYYACADYVSINPEFGTLEDFRQLVKEAHELGFRVIIDWVANHTGWDHTWTKTNPEFYKKNAQGNFYDSYGWEDVIDLNYYDHAMRRAMTDAMLFWVKECDIDGFRCDMAHLVPLDFWRQARTALDKVKPLFWLAETEDRNYMDVFDCCYAWDFMHVSEKMYQGNNSLADLRGVLIKYGTVFPPETFQLFFTSNHDENSWKGTEYEKYELAAFVFAVFCFTWNGIPLLYSGQELPNLKRLRFFEKDTIEWKQEPELEDFYRKLMLLRRSNPAGIAGMQAPPRMLKTNAEGRVLAFIRKWEERKILVLLNFSAERQMVIIEDFPEVDTYRNIFSHEAVEIRAGQNLDLNPWDYLVLEN